MLIPPVFDRSRLYLRNRVRNRSFKCSHAFGRDSSRVANRTAQNFETGTPRICIAATTHSSVVVSSSDARESAFNWTWGSCSTGRVTREKRWKVSNFCLPWLPRLDFCLNTWICSIWRLDRIWFTRCERFGSLACNVPCYRWQSYFSARRSIAGVWINSFFEISADAAISMKRGLKNLKSKTYWHFRRITITIFCC